MPGTLFASAWRPCVHNGPPGRKTRPRRVAPADWRLRLRIPAARAPVKEAERRRRGWTNAARSAEYLWFAKGRGQGLVPKPFPCPRWMAPSRRGWYPRARAISPPSSAAEPVSRFLEKISPPVLHRQRVTLKSWKRRNGSWLAPWGAQAGRQTALLRRPHAPSIPCRHAFAVRPPEHRGRAAGEPAVAEPSCPGNPGAVLRRRCGTRNIAEAPDETARSPGGPFGALCRTVQDSADPAQLNKNFRKNRRFSSFCPFA